MFHKMIIINRAEIGNKFLGRSIILLRNRIFLYATEFFAGMSVMAVELGASRLLAPYFSSSQIVWTIIIGTIMIAMALGNVYGGRLADRDSDPARLYRRIIIAALWIAAIPFAGKYIIVLIAGALIKTIDTNLLTAAAFLSCMAIFVYPLFLLGTVTPCLVKYATDSLEHNGKVVGNLGAFQTIGSIIGTFIPTFVTIPAVGTAVTFLIFSSILLIIGLIYFVGNKKMIAVSTIAFFILSALGCSGSFAFWRNDITREDESIYNYLQVRDDERRTILSTNVMIGVQSIRVKDRNLTGMYYDYALAAPLLIERAEKKILILGMGAGTFAERCRHYFPQSEILGVEIDEKITAIAREFFRLPSDIPIVTYDGRAFLQSIDQTFDVIMVDAYQDITIPFQMSSTEFFALVREHLSEDGVLIVNMSLRDDSAGSINAHLTDTIAANFSEVRIIDVYAGSNRELFAARNVGVLDRLSTRAKSIKDAELQKLMSTIGSTWREPATGNNILTDDRAPVEVLGMRALDKLVQQQLQFYRGIDFNR